MNYNIKAESGVQLIARLNARQPVAGLEEKLFSSGPRPKETIEIKGPPSTGKTLMLTQFIMKSILPVNYKKVPIGGLNVGVIFIETDSHFNILKLVSLMERTIVSKMLQNKVSIQSKEVEEIIKSALNNLVLLSCHDSPQLFVTFHLLQSLLQEYSNVSLILLDSIAAYYQQDVKTGGIKKIDTYCRKVTQILQQCVRDYDVTVMYTKPSFFQSKNFSHEEISAEPKVGKINVKIELQNHETEPQTFIAVINNSSSVSQVKYKIGNGGIKWL